MAELEGHTAVVGLLKSHGGWTESDERYAEPARRIGEHNAGASIESTKLDSSETSSAVDTTTSSMNTPDPGCVDETKKMNTEIPGSCGTSKQGPQGHVDIDQGLGSVTDFGSFFLDALGE